MLDRELMEPPQSENAIVALLLCEPTQRLKVCSASECVDENSGKTGNGPSELAGSPQ